MISVSHLTKQYASQTAVNDISFEVPEGEIVGFLGPNGAGKTTTMRILSGYMPPTSGSARVAGFDVFRDSLQVRQNVGYMPENAPLYLDMKVKEYLHFRAGLKGLHGKDLRDRTGDVMEMCQLTDMRRRLIGNLSKGYRQRVALADALLARPKLLILDEPTNGLDPTQIRGVRELLRRLKGECTVLLSTHILAEVELTCDRVIIMHKGQIKAADTPRNLSKNLRAASNVTLDLTGAKSTKDVLKKLEQVAGVRKANAGRVDGEWQRYNLRIEAQTDVREAIQTLATKEDWKVRELHRKLPSLEDVFIELASDDS
jgi:ABC-2 type transport system ATP-binding protein